MAERLKGTVHDVDECLFNSVDKHVKVLTKHGQQQGWQNLPSRQQVYALGGTHAAYGHYPGYQEKNAAMIADPDFNRGLETISGATQAMNCLAANVLIYLTARPEKLAELTREELLTAGFPDREVIARPATVSVENVTAWKVDVLQQLASQYVSLLRRHSSLVMIDDSAGLHEVLIRLRDPRIESLLFKGPITPHRPAALTWAEIVKRIVRDNSRHLRSSSQQVFTVSPC